MSDTQPRPTPAELVHLRPSNGAGLLRVGACLALTSSALVMSTRTSRILWLVGQLLLGIALVQWFVILHESGHGTLFRTRWLHAPVGHLAGLFAAIPFLCWKRVHGRHHKWTGYQDLDPTTQALVPRHVRPIERALVNSCWKYSIPLFSILYRAGNFWNVLRLHKLFERRVARAMAVNAAVLAAVYAIVAAIVGPLELVRLVGVGLLVSLAIEDPLLLSQHTHIPQLLSRGAPVRPFPAIEQEVFTRSLRFPSWISTFVLHFDAHELHHMYPFLPGYNLRQVSYNPVNEVNCLRWLWNAKKIPGEVFLFKNRNDTGFNI